MAARLPCFLSIAQSGRSKGYPSQEIGADRGQTPKEIIGALIVEQIETQIPRDVLEGRVDLVYEHSCRALANTLSYNDMFLMQYGEL